MLFLLIMQKTSYDDEELLPEFPAGYFGVLLLEMLGVGCHMVATAVLEPGAVGGVGV